MTALKITALHPSLGAEVPRGLLQGDHAMSNRVKLEIRGVRGTIIEHQHGALLGREELLECEDLAAIPQGALRQKSHF